jgi:dGTPase
MSALYSAKDADRAAEASKSEIDEPYRSPYRRDIARLIHSPSFRRLQGKTQVFPGNDSDFFRNRLSHSLEVAQIAKSLAIKLNATDENFEDQPINPDIVEFAALAHDLGHPPFGHNGEEALDELMSDYGGFEGNAQTLHILAKVEKKEVLEKTSGEFVSINENGVDLRCGLNLTYRTLASVLKYDRCIPSRKVDRRHDEDIKGYYIDEQLLVEKIKEAVLGISDFGGDFKTIECSIMDISDDIAYSTYDLEDCFKAKFLTPLDLFTLDNEINLRVVQKVRQRIKRYYGEVDGADFELENLVGHLYSVFAGMFEIGEEEEKFLQNRSVTKSQRYRRREEILYLTRGKATLGAYCR